MDRHNWPKVSIVTPSYNQGQFLEETIRSVLDQNYPNLEYIIIDGGSTDNSVEIIRKYEDRLAYWVSEPDRGQAHAVNKGFREATGEILAWQNSDDTYQPGAIRTVMKYFKNNPKVYMIYGDFCFMDEKGEIFSYRALPDFSIRRFVNGVRTPPQPTVFFKKQALEEVGYLDESLNHCMDRDLYIRIGKKYPIKHIPKIVGNFRIHHESKTMSQKKKQFTEGQVVRERYIDHKIGSLIFSTYYNILGLTKDFIHQKIGIFSIRDRLKFFSREKYLKARKSVKRSKDENPYS